MQGERRGTRDALPCPPGYEVEYFEGRQQPYTVWQDTWRGRFIIAFCVNEMDVQRVLEEEEHGKGQ